MERRATRSIASGRGVDRLARVRAPSVVQTARVTVLFADLRGYTRLAEILPAARVVPLLDEFFRVLVTATEMHAGKVFHMAGDAMMAGFGVDGEAGSCARDALAAGHAMLETFSPIAARWRSELSIDAGIGVGLHLGRSPSALGPPRHKTTTLVGDTVNVAARLCGRGAIATLGFCSRARWHGTRCGAARRNCRRRRGALPAALRNSNCAGAAGPSTSGACRRRGASLCRRPSKLLNSLFSSPRGGIGRRNGLKIR